MNDDRRRGVALISGAGSGIGREIALALGKEGYSLALLGRTEDTLTETLGRAGGDGRALICDVRRWSAVERVVTGVEAELGPVEAVVPAAGVVSLGPLGELEPEEVAAMLETNLLGAFHLFRACLAPMRERGRGRLVPILSVAATTAFPGWSGYCASKWGLAGMVAALRQEVAGSGIGVTAIYPGATDTPLWTDLPGEWDRSEMVPAEEVARAVVYALGVDEPALVEEVRIGPAGGAL